MVQAAASPAVNHQTLATGAALSAAIWPVMCARIALVGSSARASR
jgi:hypothetical protein